jgi:hypothetical protein
MRTNSMSDFTPEMVNIQVTGVLKTGNKSGFFGTGECKGMGLVSRLFSGLKFFDVIRQSYLSTMTFLIVFPDGCWMITK